MLFPRDAALDRVEVPQGCQRHLSFGKRTIEKVEQGGEQNERTTRGPAGS